MPLPPPSSVSPELSSGISCASEVTWRAPAGYCAQVWNGMVGVTNHGKSINYSGVSAAGMSSAADRVKLENSVDSRSRSRLDKRTHCLNSASGEVRHGMCTATIPPSADEALRQLQSAAAALA